MTQTFEPATGTDRYIRAAKLADVQAAGSLIVNLEKHTIALFYSENKVYAIDNSCFNS
jgi:nitrite reductase/ring-hydroxylating ferredoxin subunit